MAKNKAVKRSVIKKVGPKRKRGRQQIYPVGQWFDGKKHLLRMGVDFKSNLKTIINYLYALASKRNCNIKITNCLEIKATKEERKSA